MSALNNAATVTATRARRRGDGSLDMMLALELTVARVGGPENGENLTAIGARCKWRAGANNAVP